MYTFHSSKIDGTPDQQITSGQVGSLFDTLDSQERVAGDQDFAKLWITSDTDLSTYVGLSTPMPYTSTIFVSANDNDTEGDLTGSEARYGAMKVVSATVTDIIVNNSFYVLVRVGDFIIVSSRAYEVGSVTDNGDGTSTIMATIDYAVAPVAGDYITSVLLISLVTAIAKPVWREEKVDAGSDWFGEYATANILLAD